MFFSNIKYPRQIEEYRRSRDKKLYSYADAANRSAIVNKTINDHFGKEEPIRFLDAGGSKRDLLSDVSKVSYSINIAQDSFVGADHVDHFAVANIERIPFVDNAFDVVCCSNVLEHVSQPIVCVEEMLRVTKPNGLLFIEGPIPNSLQGFITRFTPFLFHVWVYRALGVKTAGTPGKAPFPTFFAPGSDPDDIYDRLQNRCTLIESSLYTSVHTKRLKNKSKALFKIYDAIDLALSVVTFGKIIYGRSDFVFILRKNIAEHGR